MLRDKKEYEHVAKPKLTLYFHVINFIYISFAKPGIKNIEAQPNHAILMARFARDCQMKMGHVTRDLEISLGPDCSDLKMRIGMHSGPVTAGGK